MRARRRGRVTALGEILSRVYPNPNDWPTIRAVAAWTRSLPARVVRHARPVRVDRGVMWVHVTSPVWSQQLSLLAPSLLERIRAEPGAARVRELRFRVGPLPALADTDGPATTERPPARRAPRDPGLDAALARIGDADLRAVVDAAIDASLVHEAEAKLSGRTRRTPTRAT